MHYLCLCIFFVYYQGKIIQFLYNVDNRDELLFNSSKWLQSDYACSRVLVNTKHHLSPFHDPKCPFLGVPDAMDAGHRTPSCSSWLKDLFLRSIGGRTSSRQRLSSEPCAESIGWLPSGSRIPGAGFARRWGSPFWSRPRKCRPSARTAWRATPSARRRARPSRLYGGRCQCAFGTGRWHRLDAWCQRTGVSACDWLD